MQEFERDFPHPPRPDFGRDRRWNEDEGRGFPEFPDEGGFRRHPRDEFRGRGEDRFFREREFGRPHDFDADVRLPDDRRPPSEWEREDPLHPAFRCLRIYYFTFILTYTILFHWICICRVKLKMYLDKNYSFV